MKQRKKSLILLLVSIGLLLWPVNAFADSAEAVVIMYHRVSDEHQSNAFTISTDMFEADIKYLSDLGYTFCRADELDKAVKEKKGEKLVAITFDDGYQSDYETVLPILKKYNACATFFIIGAKINTPGYLTEKQLKALAESGVAQIGNHTYAIHEQPREQVQALCVTAPEKIVRDVLHNQERLKSITGQDITAFSYPYGVYGRYIDSLLKQQGLITFSSDETMAKAGSQPYGRFNRAFDISVEQILQKIGNNKGF